MKKILICLGILAVSFVYASQRVVVAEEFTATWCPYCPGAARGLDENYGRDYDSVVVIAYHSSSSDPFYSPEAAQRATYYNLSGYPTSWFDGIISEVGGEHYGNMYPFYRRHITTRLAISSPLTIDLTCSYDTVANTGTVNASITNTSNSAISGTLHFVIVENDIPYNWQGMTKLDFLMRDMLPDANGEAVSIPAGGNIVRSRNFTIGSTWNENNCKIVVFVQASNREIYQGAEIGITGRVNMDYYGLTFTEVSGNNNHFAQPGEAIRAYIMGKNNGDGTYTGGATISTSDPYITITSATPQTVAIKPGDVDTVLVVDFDISASCPTPRTVQFLLNFGTPNDTNTINFIITNQTGFADNMEAGQGSWMHYGTRDNWHLTTHKSNSPTHSWYCGVEGTWQYTNENDASLISPYFVATPDSSLKFYHQYAFETGWDYGYLEIDNGSGWWQTIAEYNGTQSSWIQASYPLNNYAGQTIRLRFRFISDYSTVWEGWYIDDVKVPSFVAIEEVDDDIVRPSVTVYPNPFTDNLTIKFQIQNPKSAISLKIYDASGRMVRQWDSQMIRESNKVSWYGDDDLGRKLSPGIYFIKLNAEREIITKAVLVR